MYAQIEQYLLCVDEAGKLIARFMLSDKVRITTHDSKAAVGTIEAMNYSEIKMIIDNPAQSQEEATIQIEDISIISKLNSHVPSAVGTFMTGFVLTIYDGDKVAYYFVGDWVSITQLRKQENNGDKGDVAKIMIGRISYLDPPHLNSQNEQSVLLDMSKEGNSKLTSVPTSRIKQVNYYSKD
jgi:hypothetical protein